MIKDVVALYRKMYNDYIIIIIAQRSYNVKYTCQKSNETWQNRMDLPFPPKDGTIIKTRKEGKAMFEDLLYLLRRNRSEERRVGKECDGLF